MDEIGIVILNYLNWTDTIDCIDSLKNQTTNKFQVVVVDNDSDNESLSELHNKYKHIENIHILNTDKNLGYAKGNNYGINYCLNILNIQNILIINNDTIFNDDKLVSQLAEYSINRDIGAIGFKIIGKDLINQNPVKYRLNLLQLLKSIMILFFARIGIRKPNIFKHKTVVINEYKKGKVNNLEKEGYILHGSAIFLTENYLKKVNGFYPNTFLYFEENILAIIMKKLKLNMVYDSGMSIYHKEDQSSQLVFNNESKTQIQYLLQGAVMALKVWLQPIEKVIKEIND